MAYDGDDVTMAYVNLTYIDPMTRNLHTEKGEVGKFGAGKIDSASGIVVHVRTRNGTSNFGCDFPFENPLPKDPWIALLKRGQCTFNKKIINAAQSNASAVVVYDNKDGTLQKMHYRVPNMVGVFVSNEKGMEIAELVDNGTTVWMYITVGAHHSVRYSNINRTSVLFVSISFIVLMIISLAWLVFYYVQRFRYIHAKDQLARRLCSAAKKALAKIPTRTIRVGDKEAEAEVECCAVCIEPYRVHDVVRTLPCKHIFHKSCVDPWLLDQRTCPMCKMDILKFYGLVVCNPQYTGSQESILQVELDNERDSDMFGGSSSATEGGGGSRPPPSVIRADLNSLGPLTVQLPPVSSAALVPAPTVSNSSSQYEERNSEISDASSCDSTEPLHNSVTCEALDVIPETGGAGANTQQTTQGEPPSPSTEPREVQLIIPHSS